MDAVLRLASLLENQKHIPVLALLLKKEIIYWILQGPHGETLEQMALEGSNASRIREVIDSLLIMKSLFELRACRNNEYVCFIATSTF
jgi:hypothetical protein